MKSKALDKILGTLAGVAARRALDEAFLPNHPVLIGTHHKGGTVWMDSIFSQICRVFRLPWLSAYLPVQLPERWQVLLHMHSQFPPEALADASLRGLHIIRDPRDLIVSAAYYHGTSAETWLHEARPEFEGKTYQQAINALEDISARLHFEMDHATGWELGYINDWNYQDQRFINVRSEELIDDLNLKRFHEIFEFLGFRGAALLHCLQIAYNNSLFSGQMSRRDHVRSGRPQQWKQHFMRSHAQCFNEKFPGLLEKLGYEQDTGWIERCPN